jgi:hypothetical protein
MTVLRERGAAEVSSAGARGVRTRVLAHPVVLVVLVAFGVRAVLALVINLASGGSLFQDDGTYPLLAKQYAFGDTERWSDYEYFLLDATGTLLYPLAWLYQLFGYSVLLGQLLVAAWAAAAAGFTTRLAMEGLSRRWALAPGLVVALLPSQVIFSSTVFKDAAVWALLAALALVVAVLGRSHGARTALLLACVAGLYLLLAHLRLHTLVAAAWAAAIALFVMRGRGLLVQRVGVLALTLVIPFVLQIGLGGWSLVTDASATLEDRRAGNAAGAATAFVEPEPAPVTPPVRPKPTASEPGGPPAAEPPADAEPPPPEAVGGRNVKALVRGLSVMLLEPYPTSATFENRRVTLALLENVVWWPLLLLAVVGVAQVPRERRVLAFPLLAGGAIVLLYALSEGNFGTAFRHRGEIVWAVALLATYGASSLQARRRRRAVA